MKNNFLLFLTKKSSILGLFLLALGILFFMSVPFHVDSLDARFSYSPEFVAQLLESLGPEGRQKYWICEWFDCGFLVTYSFFFLAVVQFFFFRRRMRFLNGLEIFLCFLTGILDFFETTTVLFLLHTFPNRHVDFQLSVDMAHFLSWVTPLKWTSGALVLTYFCNRILVKPSGGKGTV